MYPFYSIPAIKTLQSQIPGQPINHPMAQKIHRTQRQRTTNISRSLKKKWHGPVLNHTIKESLRKSIQVQHAISKHNQPDDTKRLPNYPKGEKFVKTSTD